MAPAYAVPRMLSDALFHSSISISTNPQASRGRVLCNAQGLWPIRIPCGDKLGLAMNPRTIDRSETQRKGGSHAIGHPFAATGPRASSSTLREILDESRSKRGLISICTARRAWALASHSER